MRTKQEIADFIRSLGIDAKHYIRLESFHSPLTLYGNHREITDFGLIVGYGDAFSYKSSGIVVVGESDVGKSQLVKKFNEEELSDILANNELLIFRPDNKGQSEVYRDLFIEPEYLIDLAGVEIVGRYVNHLANNRGVPLRAILHLTNSYPRGFAEPDFSAILSYLSGDKGTLFIPEDNSIPLLLQGVTFLKYAKGVGIRPAGFPSEESLEHAYNDVRVKLDDVLS